MTDLDKRVRYAIHRLAESVPTSENPRAELERRLAARRRTKVPVLAVVGAVAAVAVAAVAIPLALHREPDQRPAAEKTKDGLVWSSDYMWVDADAGPHVLGSFDRQGKSVDAVAWRSGAELCVGEGSHVGVGTVSPEKTPGALVDVVCEPVPAWPVGPQHSAHVETRAVLPGATVDSGPLPELMLFMTDPAVARLEVRGAYGEPVRLRELDAGDGLRLFLADFDGSTQGFGYTAYDAAGNVLDSAIT